MVNYPYATNFVNPLPAWPITAACEATRNPDFLESIKDATTSTFNFTHIGQL